MLMGIQPAAAAAGDSAGDPQGQVPRALAFMEACTGSVLRELSGFVEGWTLPETRSVQEASQHILHVRSSQDG